MSESPKGNTGGNVVRLMPDDGPHVPPPPLHLGPAARKVWAKVAPDLASTNRLRSEFEPMLEIWCMAYGEVIELSEELLNLGRTFENNARNGRQFKKRPEWAMREDAIANLVRLSDLFGLNPRSYSTLNEPAQGELFDRIRQALDG